jgi:hypothetical protein
VHTLELDDNARLEDEDMPLEDEEIMLEDEDTITIFEDDDIPLEDKNPSIEELLLLSETELLDGRFSAELELEWFIAEFEDRFSSGKCKVQEMNV